MRKDKFPKDQASKSAGAPHYEASTQSSPGETGFVPSPDEVARKAYFSYLNEGSPQGRERGAALAGGKDRLDRGAQPHPHPRF